MADYAPNYTSRYRMRYRALGQVHTAQLRIARSHPGPAAQGVVMFQDLLETIAGKLVADWTVLGADVAAADSDIFLPSSSIPMQPTVSAVAADESYKPVYLSFVGRSTSGLRAALFIYGINFAPTGADNTSNDYRILSTEDSAIASAVAVLNNGSGSAANLVANDDAPVVWYPYANMGFNSYYQRKARRG